MSRSRSATAVVWAVVQRLAPVGAAGCAAGVIGWRTGTLPVRYSFGLLYGVQLRELIAMVSLPVLAWVLWAPTATLALRVGLLLLLLLLLGVPGWGWWLSRAAVGASFVDQRALYRAYPLAEGAAGVLAVIIVYRWRQRPDRSSRASSGTFWSRLVVALRLVTGCLALVVAAALLFHLAGVATARRRPAGRPNSG